MPVNVSGQLQIALYDESAVSGHIVEPKLLICLSSNCVGINSDVVARASKGRIGRICSQGVIGAALECIDIALKINVSTSMLRRGRIAGEHGLAVLSRRCRIFGV